MLSTLTAPDLTFLFLGIVVCLGSALVAMLWQIEHQPQRRPRSRHL